MDVHTVQDLGAAVRQARTTRGMTQVALAQKAGVSREWLVRFEQGQHRLEAQLVLDTVAAAGLRLELVEDDNENADPATTFWPSASASPAVPSDPAAVASDE